MNELINHKGVYKTAPATPGLLKISQNNYGCNIPNFFQQQINIKSGVAAY